MRTGGLKPNLQNANRAEQLRHTIRINKPRVRRSRIVGGTRNAKRERAFKRFAALNSNRQSTCERITRSNRAHNFDCRRGYAEEFRSVTRQHAL